MNKLRQKALQYIDKKKLSEVGMKNTKIILTKSADIYYNSEEQSFITDAEWDKLLKVYESNGGKFLAGATPRKGKRLVDASHDMPELVGTVSKATNMNDFAAWLHSKEIIKKDTEFKICISYKYDGNSIARSGSKWLTRGKAGNGVDLTDIFKERKLPKNISSDAGLKFEVIMYDEDLEKMSEDTGKAYKNNRSVVAGILGSDNASSFSKYLTLVPLRIIDPSKNLNRIGELSLIKEIGNTKGFHQFDYKLFKGTKKSIIEEVTKFYGKMSTERKDLNYMIDGLIIEIVDGNLRKKLGRKDDKNVFEVGLKFPAIVERSTVKGIRFDFGKSGRITPVVEYEPVIFNGAECRFTSISNYKRFKELNLKIGDSIFVEYRNDVLSYIDKIPGEEVEGELIKFIGRCPHCKERLKVNKNKTFVSCVNDNCEGKIVGRIENYFTKLDIKGIKTSTIQKIVDAKGISNISELYDMSLKDLNSIEGFVKTGKTVFMALRQHTEMWDHQFFGSLSIPGVGLRTFKDILGNVNMNRLLSETEEAQLRVDLLDVKGVEEITVNKIIEYILINKNEIKRLAAHLDIKNSYEHHQKILNSDKKLLNFVFTGFRNKIIQEKLEEVGHKITGGVSSKTNVLVAKDTSGETVKLKKAREVGAEIISARDFTSTYTKYL